MSPVEVVFLFVSWVFWGSVGFVLGFYWLKTQLEDKLGGMMQMDMSQELEDLGGEFDVE